MKNIDKTEIERDASAKALASGNLLLAFDIAKSAAEQGSTDPRLRYVQVLALARMGEIDRAKAMYDQYLARETDVDTLALGARLTKDLAWRASSDSNKELLLAASQAYEQVFDRTLDPFPGINAASLAYLAGYPKGALLAQRVLQLLRARGKTPTNYYDAATEAEAHLLLGDEVLAEQAITRALSLEGSNHGARSSTSRQIAKIASHLRRGAVVVEKLRPPPVLTFCGHMFVADDKLEADLSRSIDRMLSELDIHIGYGALACGSDILIAEAILERGGELNVVLPFLIEDFKHVSVAPGGQSWIARFDRCLERASEVIVASETPSVGDEWQFKYASMLMMGYARLRALHLDTKAKQLAIWDGIDTDGHAGTAADVRAWRERGGETVLIELDRSELPKPKSRAADLSPAAGLRRGRGMIFADFAGFSKIDETRLPAFWQNVLGAAASVLDSFGADVCSRNTWGDAIYVVTQTASSAAEIALALQEAVGAVDIAYFGQGTGLRVSAHFGSVYEAVDPVTRATTFFGREVNRAARIEPIALVGQVYVTRAFGAILAMEAPGQYDLEYVGRVPLAKLFGEEPMYRLTRPSFA